VEIYRSKHQAQRRCGSLFFNSRTIRIGLVELSIRSMRSNSPGKAFSNKSRLSDVSPCSHVRSVFFDVQCSFSWVLLYWDSGSANVVITAKPCLHQPSFQQPQKCFTLDIKACPSRRRHDTVVESFTAEYFNSRFGIFN
jgi:hypothetical protein